MILLAFFSCEKEEILDCEKNQTFKLIYKNQRGYNVNLVINDIKYFVSADTSRNQYTKILQVPIQCVSLIHVEKMDGETVSNMVGRPNVCATYQYFW